MLRISAVESRSSSPSVTLLVAGQVIGPWVGVLRTSCNEVLDDGHSLTLDLADVTFMDQEGVGLFRDLVSRHVTLTNCSPFAAEQLRS
jgi:hypothetical protein